MKHITFSLFLILITFSVSAQQNIQVQGSTEKFSTGMVDCFTVTIYEAQKDDIEKAWKKLMKDYKANVDMKKEIFADNAEMTSISANTIDVYAKVVKVSDSESSLTVAFDLGGAYLSQSDAKSNQAKQIIRTFAYTCSKEAVAQQLADAENKLKDLTKEKEDLIKDKEKLNNNITGWEQDIKKAKEDIITNEKNQETNVKQLADQAKTLEAIKVKAAKYQ